MGCLTTFDNPCLCHSWVFLPFVLGHWQFCQSSFWNHAALELQRPVQWRRSPSLARQIISQHPYGSSKSWGISAGCLGSVRWTSFGVYRVLDCIWDSKDAMTYIELLYASISPPAVLPVCRSEHEAIVASMLCTSPNFSPLVAYGKREFSVQLMPSYTPPDPGPQ